VSKLVAAVCFGGHEDGATRLLTKEDIERGWVETIDGMGKAVRYTVVKLPKKKYVDDVLVGYELKPTEGVW
jgi:hypothetical protein